MKVTPALVDRFLESPMAIGGRLGLAFLPAELFTRAEAKQMLEYVLAGQDADVHITSEDPMRDAYLGWPADIRKKLSCHDLVRMMPSIRALATAPQAQPQVDGARLWAAVNTLREVGHSLNTSAECADFFAATLTEMGLKP